MRIIVTGGAGFIGSHLCERLLDDGCEVVAVDNLITGSRDNISGIADSRFDFIEQDVSVPFDIRGKADYVLHLASPASPIDFAKLPIEILKVGSYGTHNSISLAVKHGATFLLASTSETYGDPLVHPQREDYWGHVNPIGPRSVYDEAKRYAEALTMAYRRKYGLDSRIIRIFNTYGPRMRINDGRVVPAFIAQALRGEPITVFGDGTQTRSFCYVSDLVDGIVRCARSDYHLPVNLGNPIEYSILEFADELRKIIGSDAPVEFKPLPVDDPKKRRPDISLAKRVLGWEPKISLRDGLTKTVDYFRNIISDE